MKKQSNLPAARRKLSLNKKTISNLNVAEMNQYMGGTGGTIIKGGCHSGAPTCQGQATCYKHGHTC